jgi:D-3-phosphoglycerate dehydrogenase
VKILITESERFSPRARALLDRTGQVRAEDIQDRQTLLHCVPEANILWIRLRHYIDAEVMAAAPDLQAICTPTTGLNHIDLDEAARRGIEVVSLRGQTDFLKEIRATAEHTIALALALLRHVPTAASHVLDGGWNRDLFLGNELHRKTVGIVGYGRLGRIVAAYFQAFGCRVLAAERKDWEGRTEPDVSLVPLEELLDHSDLVSLHVNLSPVTERMFSKTQFEQMKIGAWLINTARGELIDETALLDALQKGKLAGAALDVLSGEHRLSAEANPLIEYARSGGNLLITPHTGGCTVESMAKTEEFLAGQLAKLIEQGRIGGDRALCAELQAR